MRRASAIVPVSVDRTAANPTERELIALLSEIRDEFRGLRADLKAVLSTSTKRSPAADDDGRYERMFALLDRSLDGLDLPFSSSETADAAALDHELTGALAQCGATDAPTIGALFRSLRDRQIGPYVLRRHDRDWSLERT